MSSTIEPSKPFAGQIGLVTGAGSGIGRAIALRYAECGGLPVLVGRDRTKLQSVGALIEEQGRTVITRACDLTQDDEIESLVRELAELERLDLVVHSAATWFSAEAERTLPSQLDEQYAITVRAPHSLNRLLLPRLRQTKGQIVFVNSSSVQGAAPGLIAYGAMRRALVGMADHLRKEVNRDGIRVLSVFPGRTATPMQQRVFESEGRRYVAGDLLQPEDVASVVIHALSLPRTAEVTDIHIRPMRNSSP